MQGYSEHLCLSIRYQGIDKIEAERLLVAVNQDPDAAGKVACLDLCGNRIASLEGLEEYSYLVSLSLSQNRLSALSSASFSFTLTHLDVSRNHLTSLAGVQGLPFLTWLDASHNQISTTAEIAQCYRLRTLLLGHNRIRSVFGLEGLLEVERLQLHGNALAGQAELRLLATLQKLKHLTLRGNPVASLHYLRLKVTHMMPGLVSLDGQPMRSGPSTPRGGRNPLARSQQTPANAATRAEPYARFETVFKAPLFDPPGTVGPEGQMLDDCEPTLDVDYAPDEAVAWLRTAVSDVAQAFDLETSALDASTHWANHSRSAEARTPGARELNALETTPLSSRRTGIHGYLVPGSPEHRAATSRPASPPPRSLWSPPRASSARTASPAPSSPGRLRTEESVGRHIARLHVAREREEERTATKSLRLWTWSSPADSSTLLKPSLRDVSPQVHTSWDAAPPLSPTALRQRQQLSETAHVDRLRRAAEAEARGVAAGLQLPGMEKKKPGVVPQVVAGAGMGGVAKDEHGRIREAASRHAERLHYGSLLAEEETRGRPLPGYHTPTLVQQALAALEERSLGAAAGGAAGQAGLGAGSQPREALRANSIAERLERRMSGSAPSTPRRMDSAPKQQAHASRLASGSPATGSPLKDASSTKDPFTFHPHHDTDNDETPGIDQHHDHGHQGPSNHGHQGQHGHQGHQGSSHGSHQGPSNHNHQGFTQSSQQGNQSVDPWRDYARGDGGSNENGNRHGDAGAEAGAGAGAAKGPWPSRGAVAGAHGGGLARDSNLYPPAARGVGQPRDSNPYPLPAASQSPSASEPGPSALTVSEGSSLTTGGAGAEGGSRAFMETLEEVVSARRTAWQDRVQSMKDRERTTSNASATAELLRTLQGQ